MSEHPEFTELQRVELILALEEEFDLSIGDADAETMKTPAGIISYVATNEAGIQKHGTAPEGNGQVKAS